jgi:hypothetical protein
MGPVYELEAAGVGGPDGNTRVGEQIDFIGSIVQRLGAGFLFHFELHKILQCF